MSFSNICFYKFKPSDHGSKSCKANKPYKAKKILLFIMSVQCAMIMLIHQSVNAKMGIWLVYIP